MSETMEELQSRLKDEFDIEFGDYSYLETLPTRLPNLDRIMGGGIPLGRQLEIFGPSGSGKTTLALYVMSLAQERGWPTAYLDYEHRLDPNRDAIKRAKCQPNFFYFDKVKDRDFITAEDGVNFLRAFLPTKDGTPRVAIIDSLAAFKPRCSFERDIGDSEQPGLQARFMSQYMPMIGGIVKYNRSILIWINQLRNKIGGYGNPEVTPGGMATPYYQTLRLRISRTEIIKNEEDGGIRSRIELIKSSTSRSHQSCEISIRDSGIDLRSALFEELKVREVIRLGGSYYNFAPQYSELAQSLGLEVDPKKGMARIGQGEKSVMKLLSDSDVFDKLYETVLNT
jgi:recombination protein RecA